MPWGYPQYPVPLSQYPAPPPQQMPGPGPKVMPQAANIPQTPVRDSDPNSESSPVQDLKAWCVQHALGEAEYEGLLKLGFRVGDGHELAGLEMSLWEWAGIAPLARARILSACQTTVSSCSN